MDSRLYGHSPGVPADGSGVVLSRSGSVEMRAPQIGWLSSAVIILFEIHSVVVGYDWYKGEKCGVSQRGNKPPRDVRT